MRSALTPTKVATPSTAEGFGPQHIIIKKRKKFMNKKMFKKSSDELQEYLAFKRRGFKITAKKGKGSYKRHEKHRNKEQ